MKLLYLILIFFVFIMSLLVSYNSGKMVGWEMGWNDATENYFTNKTAREFPAIFYPTGFWPTNKRFFKNTFSKERIFE